jgi:hypothetical protein
MPGTYEPIATYKVTGSNLLGTTGVTFSSIPQTYTDLVVVQTTKVTAPAINVTRIGNNTINTNGYYGTTQIGGSGGTASSTRYSGQSAWGSVLAHQTGDWGNYNINIQNYSSSSTFKTALAHFNNYTYGASELIAYSCQVNLPINMIQLYLDRAEYYVVGSTFTLYGIKAA